ncbi:MAG: hypothetical protein K8E24_015635 [Methanobacterium paludis]|nr:hypothetical protein [Methanobacterium paludis]
MRSTINSFVSLLQGMGSYETLRRLADEGHAPKSQPLVNAHVHLPPNFSAFAAARQPVDLASEQNVRVLGASNYYDYSVYGEFSAAAIEKGIFPLFGLEAIVLIDSLVQGGVKINDPGNFGKMYICGKGISKFDAMNDEAKGLLQVIRDNDSARMAAVTKRLAEVFAGAGLDTGLDADAIKDRLAARFNVPRDTVYLQERHLAQAFQESLFELVAEEGRTAVLERAFGGAPKSAPTDAVSTQNEIRSKLMKAGKPAFVEDTFVGFDHAYRLILALGGIPCYPTLADGVKPLCGNEDPVENLIADLKSRGVHAAEFIPNRNSAEALRHYVLAMRKAGLVVTAGTEHNSLDLLPIAPVCAGGEAIPDDVQAIFWEGACVLAAHEYLSLLGRPGFVDAQWVPNTAYATDGQRIEAFRALGAAVIARYQDACAGKKA